MEDRLLKLLDAEQLSSSKFADVISVQRSSVSHILSGRNKPSFDFLQKTLKAFPHLNADWLILGEGKMYESGDFAGGGSLFDQAEPLPTSESSSIVTDTPSSSELPSSELDISANSVEIPVEMHSNKDNIVPAHVDLPAPSGQVVKVILLYADNSFDSYNPGE